MTRPARVLVADDHAPTREDVRTALNADERFAVVAVAGDAAGAVQAAVRERPDLALLDMRMPGSGAAAAWEITARLPDTRAVMLTISRTDDDLFAALRAGASGYLLKDADPARLPHALRGVLDGEAALPRTLTARLIEEFRERGRRRRLRISRRRSVELTPREWDVLELLNERRTTAEMAERLSVSPVTIRRHVSEILQKLRVPDRSAALRLLERRSDI
jgi:DNA-binding NarL/FixJ family response regulator